MTRNWMKTALPSLLAGACLVLASCGGGSVVSDLKAERFIVVGDDFSDVGQNGHRYTVNDGSSNWVQDLAGHYDLTVQPETEGGFGYAQGRARVATPGTLKDGTVVPSVVQQIDALLARTELGKRDVVLINGGMNDVVSAVEQYGTSEAAREVVDQAARDLAAQIHRVVDAGATHVAVTGLYNLGHSPWARALGLEGESGPIGELSVAFNDRLLIEIVDMGDTVLYFDAGLFYNLIANEPDDYPLDNAVDPVCTTPDASTCTPSTVVQPDYNRYLFADGLNFTPKMSRVFADRDYSESAYNRFRHRW